MERLTIRKNDGSVEYEDVEDALSYGMYRLADYEDTGYTPDEIKDMETELSNLRFNALMDKNKEWED